MNTFSTLISYACVAVAVVAAGDYGVVTPAPYSVSPVTPAPSTLAPAPGSMCGSTPDATPAVTPASTTSAPVAYMTAAPYVPLKSSSAPYVEVKATEAPHLNTSTYAPAVKTVAPSVGRSPLINQMINNYNTIRAYHNLNPVTYDDALAAKIQKFANSCPGFRHGGPAGFQNLATFNPQSTVSAYKKQSATGPNMLWYEEIKDWDFKKHQCRTGNWELTGHFSNMMGPKVTSFACGYSSCKGKWPNLIWCNYKGAETKPKIPTAKANVKSIASVLVKTAY